MQLLPNNAFVPNGLNTPLKFALFFSQFQIFNGNLTSVFTLSMIPACRVKG